MTTSNQWIDDAARECATLWGIRAADANCEQSYREIIARHFAAHEAASTALREETLLDAERWQACKVHGFPRHVLNPQYGIDYWQVKDDDTFPISPEAAIDAAMCTKQQDGVK